jgi:cell division protein FtsI (penicillin-binding protein 3)
VGARARRGATGATVRAVAYSTSPLLASKTPPGRSRLLVVMVGLGFLVLAGRALYVQVWDADFFLKKGEERYAANLTLSASRGRIVDRNGQILAISIAAPTVTANPRQMVASPDQRRQLAALLGLSTKELASRLGEDSAYVVLQRQLDDVKVQQIRTLGIKGLGYEPGYLRRYPESEAAAHVVGFTDVNDHGQEGVELAFQRELQGRGGSRSVVKDRFGRVVEDLGEPVDPRDGRDVELTLDTRIQALAFQRLRDGVKEHGAKGGSIVVLDAQNGDILALANYPSYAPGDRRNLSGEQLRNRAITDVFEPGSTVKPFVIGRALELGLVRPDTVLDTTPFRVGPLLVHDSHTHDQLTVAQVIQKSSNVGTVHIAQRMESRDMWETFTELGFGQKPQIGFPGAATGRLRPYRSWRPVEKATMAYGYGLSVSLLQIARAYTALTRDGTMAPVTLVEGGAPKADVDVFKPATARTMRGLLRGTVSDEGTAPLAQPPSYSAGGKTGTAEIQVNHSYNSHKYRAWFVGFAPVDHPRVIVAVMIDEPVGEHYGGTVAGPVFGQVVEQTLRSLGVAPDYDAKPALMAQAAVGALAGPEFAPQAHR